MSIHQAHTLFERFCNLLRVEARELGSAEGLLPVQIEVLHFLMQCNRYSDSLQGVSEFLGQTKGSVSQTIKLLEGRGLIGKQPDVKDRRIIHLRLTPAGRKLVKKVVPARFLSDSLRQLPQEEVDRLIGELRELLRLAQLARGNRSFGSCESCRFNEALDNGGFRCGLTGESLSRKDIQKICREHQYPTVSRGKLS